MYVGLAALLAALWLHTLAHRPLFNPDEGRYAEIPREMLAGGDWVIPHLNGLAYVEKPPLQYWATAMAYRLLGVSEFAARFYTALTALGTVGVVWCVGRRLWSTAAAWRAAGILCSMLLFLVMGQLVTLDMSLTFYMAASLASFMGAQASARPRAWMLVAWIAAALGVLTKGLVAGVIPAAVLVLYSFYSRDWRPWRRLHAQWGIPLFLAITVPWHWLAAARLPDFLQFFFVHEHFARYLTPVADRQEPWWYFGAVFIAGTAPWTLSSLRVLLAGWRRDPPGSQQFQPALFLWIWVIFVVLFFSLSDSKLMPYILPALPALALAIAVLPAPALNRDFTWTALFTVLAGIGLGAASLNWSRIMAFSPRSAYFLPLSKTVGEMALLLAVSGAFVLAQRARDATRAGVFLGVGWSVAWLVLIRGAAWVSPIYSGVDLAAAAGRAGQDGRIYSVATYDQTLPFYLHRTVTLVAYRGELAFGLQHAPREGMVDIEGFLRLWASQPTALAVMEKGMFDDLKNRGIPMRVVAENVKRVLVSQP